MNGIINVLKPTNMTSFDVVAYLRRVVGERKIGHTGTLDPMATGVLPVCIGKATGVIDYILNKDKSYVAEIVFGKNTTTEDATGKVTEVFDNNASIDEIKGAICSFEGGYSQIPPMYSAVKINGQKLCDLARKGEVIKRAPRSVKISNIEVVSIKDNTKAIFRCDVSKGTYIRTLCYDIGKKLGIGAYMSFLVRDRVGEFEIQDALTLEKIKSLSDSGKLDRHLLCPDCVLQDYPRLPLSKEQEKKFLNGNLVKLRGFTASSDYYRVYGYDERFIAIGILVKKDDVVFIKSKKLFA
ncbi:MAG: tRNA pseudouridine(55) synthase TruB [Clostridiales bacterium]|nr:tRNA pseudouridine(55) synthase TruB [Clostridiales bacterium]